MIGANRMIGDILSRADSLGMMSASKISKWQAMMPSTLWLMAMI